MSSRGDDGKQPVVVLCRLIHFPSRLGYAAVNQKNTAEFKLLKDNPKKRAYTLEKCMRFEVDRFLTRIDSLLNARSKI